MDTKSAISLYMYGERLKSEHIITHRIISILDTLQGDELNGARKLAVRLVNAVLGEVRIARNATQLTDFDAVLMELQKAIQELRRFDNKEAQTHLSQAVSKITTLSASAASVLEKNNLL